MVLNLANPSFSFASPVDLSFSLILILSSQFNNQFFCCGWFMRPALCFCVVFSVNLGTQIRALLPSEILICMADSWNLALWTSWVLWSYHLSGVCTECAVSIDHEPHLSPPPWEFARSLLYWEPDFQQSLSRGQVEFRCQHHPSLASVNLYTSLTDTQCMSTEVSKASKVV